MAAYRFFVPEKGSGPFPLVLILPILGRLAFLPDFWVEYRIARFFVRKRFCCAVIQRDFFDFIPGKGLEQIDEYLWTTVGLARQTLDALSKSPKVDSNKIFSLGISFGGILNVLLCASEPQIKAGVVALAGGNIPGILATSGDPLVRGYYRQVRKKTKLDRKTLTARLKALMKAEPLNYAANIEREKILFVSARHDRVVQAPYSRALYEALGRPEKVILPLGHYLSLLALPYLQHKALEFFNRKLSG